jgi:hypothetical protein
MEPDKCEEWAWKTWHAEIPQPRFLPLDTLVRARFLFPRGLQSLRSFSRRAHINSLLSFSRNRKPRSTKQGFCPFDAA